MGFVRVPAGVLFAVSWPVSPCSTDSFSPPSLRRRGLCLSSGCVSLLHLRCPVDGLLRCRLLLAAPSATSRCPVPCSATSVIITCYLSMLLDLSLLCSRDLCLALRSWYFVAVKWSLLLGWSPGSIPWNRPGASLSSPGNRRGGPTQVILTTGFHPSNLSVSRYMVQYAAT